MSNAVRRRRFDWRYRAWSYRAKVPLLIIAISLATALAISGTIAISARHWLKEDLHDHAAAVAQSLSRGLVVHMARDDVWEAFEAVRAVGSVDSGGQRCDVVVLDRNGVVFVSSEPSRFAVGAAASSLSEPLKQAAALTPSAAEAVVADMEAGRESFSIVRMPLVSADGEAMGALLMSYSHAVFAARYSDTVSTLALISLGFAALLLPVGWWFGHRLASPVARATETLYQLAEYAAAKSTAYAATSSGAPLRPSHPSSELERLEHSVEQLQQQLHEKEQLQEQFVAADRLAAIGRMTSGVAHEINNPLAGMLNALSNLRRDPSLLSRTIALLERGLEQIRQTLSALLIETKTATRPLSAADIADLHVLVIPQASRKYLELLWSSPIEGELDVPAAPVRQVLLNLLLNAVQAAQTFMSFEAQVTPAEVVLRVTNDGVEFPTSRRDHPFEPAVGGEGHGLGLWASHQLVMSMGGSISLSSTGGETTFEVRLPLHPMPGGTEPTTTCAEIPA
ncbi:MAG TPA: HAMP domain-containing sensor histidine kinase [Albitalea sp.]|uniref:sensor histidine kinase n=1 Tax=Piscinibacter sp. TaxID=1903157 RepID=UPI002ED41795